MGNPQVQLYQTLVTHFGSQENTATALLVKQPAVSGWVCGTKKMSAQTALRANTFSALDLRPSLKRDFSEICVS